MNELKHIIELAIVAEYPYEVVSTMDCLQSKGDRFVFKAKLDNDIYIIKVSSPLKTKDEVERDLCIFDFAIKKNFPYIQKLVKTKTGSKYAEIEGRFFYILEYIDGKNPEDNKQAWAQIGNITAELHNLVGYTLQSNLDPEKEKTKLLEKLDLPSPIINEYRKIVNGLADFSNTEKALIHTDVGLHNSIQSDEKIYFIDWDDVGIGYAILDIGYPLLTQFLGSGLDFNQDSARAFYLSYFKTSDIKIPNEKLIFEASLLFLLMYLQFTEIESGWKKIQFVISHRDMFEKFLREVINTHMTTQ